MQASERTTWDVVVIGAGPAGALAAHELARRGVPVLLVEKAAFPRWKVCGSCLNSSALSTLEQVGLGDLPQRLGAAPLTSFRFAACKREAHLALPGGVALSRSRLDAALVEAAVQAGATFLDRTCAEVAGTSLHGRQLVLRHLDKVKEIAARFVLVADGLGGQALKSEPGFRTTSAPGSWIGANAIISTSWDFFDTETIFMACGTGGYVGAVRLEDGRLNVAAALDPAFLKDMGSPQQAVVRLLSQAGWPAPAELVTAAWRGTPTLTRQAAPIALKRILLLGDAAGYVEPFTGEGIAWALTSAAVIVPLVCEALSSSSFALENAWTDLHREMIGKQQRRCKWITRFVHHPRLVQTALLPLQYVPGLAAPLVHRLNLSHFGN